MPGLGPGVAEDAVLRWTAVVEVALVEALVAGVAEGVGVERIVTLVAAVTAVVDVRLVGAGIGR